jgi:hypothetical protein
MSEHAPVEIEVVRGRLTDQRAEQVLAFWERHGALSGDAARRRLRDLVCVLVDERDEVIGVNSVFAANVEHVGSLRFWVHRAFLPGPAEAHRDALLTAAFDALADGFEPASGAPVGVCVLVEDPARRPEAEWPERRFVHAGFTAEGTPIRVAYFPGALIPLA